MNLNAIDALLPPCPTCGGTGRRDITGGGVSTICCPVCINGKVSIERLVAVYNLIDNHRSPHAPVSMDIRSFCRYAIEECTA